MADSVPPMPLKVTPDKGIFRKEADYRLCPDGVRVLLTPVSWEEEYLISGTRTLTAPAGMIHDGASIPILLSFLNGPSVQLAATLHDAAYRFHAWDSYDSDGNLIPAGGEPMTRREADRMIRESAKACQVRARKDVASRKAKFLWCTHLIQRWVIWGGLLFGGIRPWARSPEKQAHLDHEVLGEIEQILKALRLANSVDHTIKRPLTRVGGDVDSGAVFGRRAERDPSDNR